jgi:subtilisin family serine protease
VAGKVNKPKLPELVFAEVSPKSPKGESLFEAMESITTETVSGYQSDRRIVGSTVEKLGAEGFDVRHISPRTISVAAPAKVYERVFKTKIVPEERETVKRLGVVAPETFLECPDSEFPGLIDAKKSPLADLVEGVALNQRVYCFNVPSPFPPRKEYWHLTVPQGVSLGVNADLAHRRGFTGRGVRVVMVDSGWYRHPFFEKRGYTATDVVLPTGASNPEVDEDGHGTGESANIFAVAPDVKFTMVKFSDVDSLNAFKTAVDLNPDIISCSWGRSKQFPPLTPFENALAAAVADAVAKGIIVIFAAGNSHWGFPGQHPDVISAGGAYMHADGSLEASNYSSGFQSKVYAGRRVPDVSGLVGMQPGASYIMLPIQPGGDIDTRRAGGIHPPGDETAADDGWSAFSGTSAAAPQVAGVCALMKEACPWLTPTLARDILKRTARDVTQGQCHGNTGGNHAFRGPDLATGFGLVDADAAVAAASMAATIRADKETRVANELYLMHLINSIKTSRQS